MKRSALAGLLVILLFGSCTGAGSSLDLPLNTWTKISRDEEGARRHSSFRFVPQGRYFLQWGFMGYETEFYGSPEEPPEDTPEYDLVYFEPQAGRWQNHLPFEKQREWNRQLPPLHMCNSYQGITTGSYRPQLKIREGVLRPDLNIVFDQLAYDSRRDRMLYFTGGRTFAYDLGKRLWSAIDSEIAPPPVLGGSLCYDPANDEMVLTGGGHVAERGPEGRLVGYTGTWIHDCEAGTWRPLQAAIEPPPRMASRVVYDTKNQVMVLFGGDAQSRYLADTWIYDTRTRRWRASQSPGSPPARAGHFTVYDPGTGWVIIGGGYNHDNLSDMWAYDAARDRWFRLKAQVPTGWYITGDNDPEAGLIILTTSTKPEGDTSSCNEIYSVRTTYGFRISPQGLVDESVIAQPQQAVFKRPPAEATAGTEPDEERRRRQEERLSVMPDNTWVRLSNPGRTVPARTWGSCSFDTHKGRIVYWGGGHCGYGGNDYDFYDVAENTWISKPTIAEYPERAWDKGINPAGVTFNGAPWIRHGRKAYAYDPVSGKVINMKSILLTAGYNPEVLSQYEPRDPYFGNSESFSRSGYAKRVTWGFDPHTEQWELICTALPGLDLTVSTPRGVMAVNYHWESLNRWNPKDYDPASTSQVKENAVYVLDVAAREWRKLSGEGPWPQNLYEMTALIYDSHRDQLILHGGGGERDELWTFRLQNGRWKKLAPSGAKAPVCRREAVYIPSEDVIFTCGYPPGEPDQAAVYVYRLQKNSWHRVNIPPPQGLQPRSLIEQNRALTYDPVRNLVLMVRGERRGDVEEAVVYALRYRDGGS